MGCKVGNPLRKLVLLKLADNANDQGECWPSYQYIADQCEIGKSTVKKHIKDLEKSGFLRIENRKGPKGNTSNLYHLNTNPRSPDSTHGSPDSIGGGSPDSTRISHSIESVIEPNNPLPVAKVKEKYSDADYQFAEQAFGEILKLNPSHKKPNLKKWAEDVRKMREIDKLEYSEMAQVWMWVRNDSFWQTNVLSISKFREKYDQLKMKSNQRSNNYEGNGRTTTTRPDNSAAGRVRQNAATAREAIAREIAEIGGDSRSMGDNGFDVRP